MCAKLSGLTGARKEAVGQAYERLVAQAKIAGPIPEGLNRTAFVRIAAQAGHSDTLVGEQMLVLARHTAYGGFFLNVGHGGPKAPCGGVAARQAQLDDRLDEPARVDRLVQTITPRIRGLVTPNAEVMNARSELGLFLFDNAHLEQTELPARGIKPAYSVLTGTEQKFHFNSGVKMEWVDPSLTRFGLYLTATWKRALTNRDRFDGHRADAVVVFDPWDLVTALTPVGTMPELDIFGVSCVDARMPSLLHTAVGAPPNSIFAGTAYVSTHSGVLMPEAVRASLDYGYGHVGGVNSLNHHGETGHGLTFAAASSFEAASSIRTAMLEDADHLRATANGETFGLIVINLDSAGQRVIQFILDSIGLNQIVTVEPSLVGSSR